MVFKSLLVVCASALFIQAISANCIGYGGGIPSIGLGSYGAANVGGGYGAGLGCGAAASGGGLAVSSVSPIAPTGVVVVSENAIEGPLEVVGQLPVLSAVALEGQVPTAGAAGSTYSCGGNVGISGESLAAAGLAAANNIGLANAGLGYNNAGLGFSNAGLGFSNAGLGFSNAGLLNSGLAGINAGRPCGCSK